MKHFKFGFVFLANIVLADLLKKFNLISMPALNEDTFAHLLDQYHHLNLIMHIDNASSIVIGNYLAKRHIDLIIYNYDCVNTENLTRPVGRNSLNLIMLKQPANISNYLKNLQNIKHGDIMMFLTREATFKVFQQTYAKIPNLKRAGRVVVLCFLTTVDMYTMCFYCGKSSGMLTYSQSIAYGEELVKTSKLFADDFRNLNRHVLKVAYINYFPYINCSKKLLIENITYCLAASGTEYELLLSTSVKLNFTFQLIEIQNQSYRVLLHELVDGRYDLAIGGLSVTFNRLQKLQFGDVVRFEKVVFAFPTRFHFKLNFFIFMDTNFKLLLIVVTSIVITIMCFILKYLNKNRVSFLKIFLVSSLIIVWFVNFTILENFSNRLRTTDTIYKFNSKTLCLSCIYTFGITLYILYVIV